MDNDVAQQVSRWRRQSQQTDRIGKNTGCKQECTGDKYDQSIDQFVARHVTTCEALLEASPHGKTLTTGQIRPHESGSHDDCECIRRTDQATDLYQQRKFYGRYNNKQQKESHTGWNAASGPSIPAMYEPETARSLDA